MRARQALPIALLLLTAVLAGIAAGCMSGRAHLQAIPIANRGEVATATDDTFCIHEVTSVRPNMGRCDKYAVGDKVCIKCADGVCPQSTSFDTDDGTWLRACTVSTTISNGACKDLWPSGTCKYYVTLTKGE